MDSVLSQPGIHRNSMVVDGDFNTWKLISWPTNCPYHLTGDVNMSSSLTSADIIGLVNYVFKGGPPPCDLCAVYFDPGAARDGTPAPSTLPRAQIQSMSDVGEATWHQSGLIGHRRRTQGFLAGLVFR